MNYKLENEVYPVEIIRKKNRNTYVRVDHDLTIKVSTGYFSTNRQILSILNENREAIDKMIERKKKEREKQGKFYYFGQLYDIIIVPSFEKIEIDGNRIYAKSEAVLQKWYKKEMNRVFEERLQYQYHRFTESIPYPKLKIRTMKTRWGVCNRRDNSVTLNSNLIYYDLTKLDYVIVHELSHFVHFDHSKEFWNCVKKYCPDYKETRKELKE